MIRVFGWLVLLVRGGHDPPDPGRRRARSCEAAGVAHLAAVPGSPGIWNPAC